MNKQLFLNERIHEGCEMRMESYYLLNYQLKFRMEDCLLLSLKQVPPSSYSLFTPPSHMSFPLISLSLNIYEINCLDLKKKNDHLEIWMIPLPLEPILQEIEVPPLNAHLQTFPFTNSLPDHYLLFHVNSMNLIPPRSEFLCPYCYSQLDQELSCLKCEATNIKQIFMEKIL